MKRKPMKKGEAGTLRDERRIPLKPGQERTTVTVRCGREVDYMEYGGVVVIGIKGGEITSMITGAFSDYDFLAIVDYLSECSLEKLLLEGMDKELVKAWWDYARREG